MDENGLADTAQDLRPLPVPINPPRAVEVDIAGRTHPGKVRANNEDNFHVVRFGRYLRTVMSSLPAGGFPEEQDRPGYGFVVADGMGGHAAGEVASHRAIALLVEFALQTPDWILSQEGERLAAVMERTAQRFEAVNEAVVAQAREVPGLWGMGSTLTLALTLGDDLIVAHVGDSPVYLLRGGALHRLTTDHTIAQQRREYDEAYAARFRNVLTRAIGMPEGGEPDIKRYRLADGDRLLLCTDGLTDMADDAAIAAELGRPGSADDVCRALIDLALARGGRDNVTVIVAAYRFPDPPAA